MAQLKDEADLPWAGRGPLPQPPGGSVAKHPAPAVGGPGFVFRGGGSLGKAFLLLLEAPGSHLRDRHPKSYVVASSCRPTAYRTPGT